MAREAESLEDKNSHLSHRTGSGEAEKWFTERKKVGISEEERGPGHTHITKTHDRCYQPIALPSIYFYQTHFRWHYRTEGKGMLLVGVGGRDEKEVTLNQDLCIFTIIKICMTFT